MMLLRIWGMILCLMLCVDAGTVRAAPGCDTLVAALNALPANGGSGKSKRFAAAAEKQRRALAATEAMVRETGCNGLFRRGEAGCVQLRDTVAKMKNNLAMLESAAGPDMKNRRAELQAQIAAAGCSMPAKKKAVVAAADSSGIDLPRGSYRTLCVRMCDGYFFPISWAVRKSGFRKDEALCKMRCPGAETKLYVHPTGTESEVATSLTGENYTALPTAFSYQKTITPDCGCGKGSVAPVDFSLLDKAEPTEVAEATLWLKDGKKLKLRQAAPVSPVAP